MQGLRNVEHAAHQRLKRIKLTVGIAKGKWEISVLAGFPTWMSDVSHCLMAGSLKNKSKLKTRDIVLPTSVTVGIGYWGRQRTHAY